MSPPNSTDKRPRGRGNTGISQPSLVADDPPDVHVVTDSDHETQGEPKGRGVRATEHAALPLTPRLASLERLLENSENPYLSSDFVRTQLAAARADKGKIYDLPWQRWVQFSSRHEDASTTIGLGPEWDISIPKFTAFLTAIRDGFGNVKKDGDSRSNKPIDSGGAPAGPPDIVPLQCLVRRRTTTSKDQSTGTPFDRLYSSS